MKSVFPHGNPFLRKKERKKEEGKLNRVRKMKEDRKIGRTKEKKTKGQNRKIFPKEKLYMTGLVIVFFLKEVRAFIRRGKLRQKQGMCQREKKRMNE